MLHRTKIGMLILCLMALTISLGSSATAAPMSDSGPIATVIVRPDSVQWQVHVAHAGLVLTVSGPDGEVYRQELAAGETPTFRLVSADGSRRADGHYTYELQVTPVIDPEARAMLAAARQSGDEAEVVEALQQAGRLPRQPLAQTGAFLVRQGAIVPNDTAEPGVADASPAGPQVPDDQVIADDLIVQGSICGGLDCVNGEAFGVHTLRLKEINTRIGFDDTSTAAGFAANDWQLTANDSASGGLNKFSIEDITAGRIPFTVEGGAPNNGIYLDSTGRVGLRTTTPVLDVHIATGNTPAIRLEQTSAGGFTAQTWDVAGNEANFFVRDVTGGSRLPFRIRPGAPTSSIDISASGDVGIGTASPQEKLHVMGNVLVDGSVTEHSDKNVKENFKPVDPQDVLARLLAIPVSTWNYKTDDPSIRHIGPTGQDFHAAFGLGRDDRHIAPLDVNGALLAAIQALYQRLLDQDAQIAVLQRQNAALHAQNVELAQRLQALEDKVNALAARP